jgi:hypothetical protein
MNKREGAIFLDCFGFASQRRAWNGEQRQKIKKSRKKKRGFFTKACCN